MSVDEEYSSRENHAVVDELGGTAYIPFEENASGQTGGSPAWWEMYH